MNKYSRKLHTNFISLFILLVIIPFIVIVGFLLYESNIILDKNDKIVNEKLSSQVIYDFNESTNQAQNLAKSILQSEKIISFIDRPYKEKIDLSYYSTTIHDYVKIIGDLSHKLNFRIYLENDTIPSGYQIFYHMKDINRIDYIERFYKSSEVSAWIDGIVFKNYGMFSPIDIQESFCYFKKIIINGKNEGVILVTLPKQELKSSISYVTSDYYYPFEVNQYKDYILYNYTGKQIDKEGLDAFLNKNISYFSNQNNVYSKINFLDKPFKIVVVSISSNVKTVIKCLLSAFFFFVIISIILFLRYNNKIIRDINYCLDSMNESITNNFKNDLSVNRKDEIYFIAQRINYLIKRIRNLISINVKQQISAKETQLIALQHQINPHFLYNTMEIFSSKMEINGLYDESSAMSAFCRILRYNIRSDNIVATLKEELLQVENYIKIQQIRNIECDLIYDISEELKNVHIIKFILQPLIENSFKYRDSSRKLIIKISARIEENDVIIEVKDNGTGISPTKVKELNDRFKESSKDVFSSDEKIGLKNINKRLKLFYGPDHYIVASVKDSWTVFTIKIHNDCNIK